MIIGVLVTLVLVSLNPLGQLRKGQDAQREHDLKQLQASLDSYLNDQGSYPQNLGLLANSRAIASIPNDPGTPTWTNYAYVVDNSSQQWNVLFAKLAFPSLSAITCPLAKMQNCLPTNYASLGYNYCVVSGSVNCGQLASTTLVPGGNSSGPGGGGGGGAPVPTAIPTVPVPFYCYCRNAIFWTDPTKDPSHECQVVQATSDSSVNYDRDCNAPTSGTGPCSNPCTQY